MRFMRILNQIDENNEINEGKVYGAGDVKDMLSDMLSAIQSVYLQELFKLRLEEEKMNKRLIDKMKVFYREISDRCGRAGMSKDKTNEISMYLAREVASPEFIEQLEKLGMNWFNDIR